MSNNNDSLCKTMKELSQTVSENLQYAEEHNVPYHENTITQSFILKVMRQHNLQSKIHIFSSHEERENGSDFIWLFIDELCQRLIPFAIQAKRLYPNNRYQAFKQDQLHDIINYANQIDGHPIYLTYNSHKRFMQSIPDQKLSFSRLRNVFSDKSDFGLFCFHASYACGVNDHVLEPLDFMSRCDSYPYPCLFPLSKIFCNSNEETSGDIFDNIPKLFRGTDQPVPEPSTPPDFLCSWFSNGKVDEWDLKEFLRIEAGTNSRSFAPSFVTSTKFIRIIEEND